MAMYPDALCVAIESDGGDAIDAAPWVHLTHEDKRSGVHRIWIAPVIARSTNLVRELVLGTIAIWEEQTPSYTSTVATCVQAFWRRSIRGAFLVIGIPYR